MNTVTVKNGERYGRLVVVKEVEPRQYKKGKVRRFLCQCDCGNTTMVDIYHLTHGEIKSCGCSKNKYLLARVINHPHDELLQWRCTEFPFHRYDMCEGDKYMQIV